MTRVLVLGADGYLGWPLLWRLQALGFEVAGLDNYLKRNLESEIGVAPVAPIAPIHERRRLAEAKGVTWFVGDVKTQALSRAVMTFKPDAIVHLAEQPSAPYSMRGRGRAMKTIDNNVLGTINVLHAIRRLRPNMPHLIKLGTMGEYGTPPYPIKECWEQPKYPGSWYHASKVADSTFCEFSTRNWELAVTDINQGIVWGTGTKECPFDAPAWRTSLHCDGDFGTVFNRFVTQAAHFLPLTIYGEGKQLRSFLHIEDSLRCIQACIDNPAAAGEFRVINQFAEIRSIGSLWELFPGTAAKYTPTPRTEALEHPYEVEAEKLQRLGIGEMRKLTPWNTAACVADVRQFARGVDHEWLVPSSVLFSEPPRSANDNGKDMQQGARRRRQEGRQGRQEATVRIREAEGQEEGQVALPAGGA